MEESDDSAHQRVDLLQNCIELSTNFLSNALYERRNVQAKQHLCWVFQKVDSENPRDREKSLSPKWIMRNTVELSLVHTCCGHQILHHVTGRYSVSGSLHQLSSAADYHNLMCDGIGKVPWQSLSCLSFCIVLFKIFWGLLEVSMKVIDLWVAVSDLSPTFLLAKLEGVPLRLHPYLFLVS